MNKEAIRQVVLGMLRSSFCFIFVASEVALFCRRAMDLLANKSIRYGEWII